MDPDCDGSSWDNCKELMDLYSGLRLPLLTVDERGRAQALKLRKVTDQADFRVVLNR